METKEILPIILAIIAVLPLWWDKLFPSKKIKEEAHKARVDALKCYDELTQDQAQRITQMSEMMQSGVEDRRQLSEKNQELKERIDKLEAEVETVVNQNKILREENGDLREWADRLVAQVITLKGKPVKPRQRNRKE